MKSIIHRQIDLFNIYEDKEYIQFEGVHLKNYEIQKSKNIIDSDEFIFSQTSFSDRDKECYLSSKYSYLFNDILIPNIDTKDGFD